MITRTTDPVEVGALIERIGSPDGVTRADLACSDNWRAYVWGGGAFVVVDEAPGVAEVHVYAFPTARGKHAVRAAREVREAEAGVTLMGRTPVDNRPARVFAALCGGRVVGVEDGQEVREWAV